MVLEKTLEPPLDCKEIKPVHPKGIHSRIFIGRNEAKAEAPVLWFKELTHWKRLWCWERLKAGGEGDDKGWDGWIASPTWWAWIWVSSRSWWWTGKPDMLHSMGSQRVGHDWAAELNGLKCELWQTRVMPSLMLLFHVMSPLRCLMDTSNRSAIKVIISASHLPQVYRLFFLFWGNDITIHAFTQGILEPSPFYSLISTSWSC